MHELHVRFMSVFLRRSVGRTARVKMTSEATNVETELATDGTRWNPPATSQSQDEHLHQTRVSCYVSQTDQ